MKTLNLNKIRISKINNLSAILGGKYTDTEFTNNDECLTNNCDVVDPTVTNNDTTGGEATGRGGGSA